MTEETVKAMFTIADIPILRMWRLPNRYLGEQAPLTDEEIGRDRPGEIGVVLMGSFARVGGVAVRRDPADADHTEGVVRAWMADYRWRYERPSEHRQLVDNADEGSNR